MISFQIQNTVNLSFNVWKREIIKEQYWQLNWQKNLLKSLFKRQFLDNYSSFLIIIF